MQNVKNVNAFSTHLEEEYTMIPDLDRSNNIMVTGLGGWGTVGLDGYQKMKDIAEGSFDLHKIVREHLKTDIL
jgi:hypothetical protein